MTRRRPRQQSGSRARPANSPFRVSVCAACTLDAAGQSGSLDAGRALLPLRCLGLRLVPYDFTETHLSRGMSMGMSAAGACLPGLCTSSCPPTSGNAASSRPRPPPPRAPRGHARVSPTWSRPRPTQEHPRRSGARDAFCHTMFCLNSRLLC